ncbi:hypothetical protein [Ideonella livida]|uniref:Uncharacterized protein n=1 Tax=Ideonella livida TaxID=2707176 RepID=A0A7C9PJ23_9BURK|nr:hypothetical protein [Ideonella livida]NDY92471.1 hypothetical protein [Ideonella livida]
MADAPCAALPPGWAPIGAVLALWNDVDPTRLADYEHWHRHEHVPERCTVPGLHWGLRWARADAARGPRFFTLYGLRDAAVLDEPAYQRLLREPTPASRAMRPALRQVTRWVCAVPAEPVAFAMAQAQLARLMTAPTVVTCADEPHPTQRAPGTGLWLARLPQAAPLPWLSATQQDRTAGAEAGAARDTATPVAWLGLLTAPETVPGALRGTALTAQWRALPVGQHAQEPARSGR